MSIELNLTPAQVAAVLGCSERTVQNLVRSQKLRAVPTGLGSVRRHVSIPESALADYQTEQAAAMDRSRTDVAFRAVEVASYGDVGSRYADKVARMRGRLRP